MEKMPQYFAVCFPLAFSNRFDTDFPAAKVLFGFLEEFCSDN
jgi:hypothetical protein